MCALSGSLSCWQEGPIEVLQWGGQSLLRAAAPRLPAHPRQAGILQQHRVSTGCKRYGAMAACISVARARLQWLDIKFTCSAKPHSAVACEDCAVVWYLANSLSSMPIDAVP